MGSVWRGAWMASDWRVGSMGSDWGGAWMASDWRVGSMGSVWRGARMASDWRVGSMGLVWRGARIASRLESGLHGIGLERGLDGVGLESGLHGVGLERGLDGVGLGKGLPSGGAEAEAPSASLNVSGSKGCCLGFFPFPDQWFLISRHFADAPFCNASITSTSGAKKNLPWGCTHTHMQRHPLQPAPWPHPWGGGCPPPWHSWLRI